MKNFIIFSISLCVFLGKLLDVRKITLIQFNLAQFINVNSIKCYQGYGISNPGSEDIKYFDNEKATDCKADDKACLVNV